MKALRTQPDQYVVVNDTAGRHVLHVRHEEREVPVRKDNGERLYVYWAQTGRVRVTPRQRRRILHKMPR